MIVYRSASEVINYGNETTSLTASKTSTHMYTIHRTKTDDSPLCDTIKRIRNMEEKKDELKQHFITAIIFLIWLIIESV